jgi:hypothetical protein
VSFRAIGEAGKEMDIGETNEIGVPKVDTMVGLIVVSLIVIEEIVGNLIVIGEIVVSLIVIEEIVVN